MNQEEPIKKVTTHFLCGKCKEKMKSHGGVDSFNMFGPQSCYCENRTCEDYGYLKVVGIKQEVIIEDEKKTS